MIGTTHRSYWAVKVIIVLLCIGGGLAILTGLFSLVGGPLFGILAGLPLLLGGVGSIAVAQLLELLRDIANHLAAIRESTNLSLLPPEQRAIVVDYE